MRVLRVPSEPKTRRRYIFASLRASLPLHSARDSGELRPVTAMNPPQTSPEEFFRRLLGESAARLAAPENSGITIPDDELHREIIVPLLPAMLGDKSIRQHWSEQAATGFPARLARHFDGGDPAPRWLPRDFEIHVTASYSAGSDARALADTLLSEDSMRDMTAALMNQLLDAVWPSLAPVAGPAEPTPAVEIPPVEIPTAEVPAAEIPEPEIPAPAAVEMPEPIVSPEPELVATSVVEIVAEILQPAPELQPEAEMQPEQQPSRALVRALCRELPASALQRGLIANESCTASAAILARRIFARCVPRTAHATRKRSALRGVA